MEQVVVVPACFEAFAVHAELAGFALFEQVERDAVDDGEVLRGVACALAAKVFAEADIEHPVQLVFDAPVLANGRVQPLRFRLQASGFRLQASGFRLQASGFRLVM